MRTHRLISRDDKRAFVCQTSRAASSDRNDTLAATATNVQRDSSGTKLYLQRGSHDYGTARRKVHNPEGSPSSPGKIHSEGGGQATTVLANRHVALPHLRAATDIGDRLKGAGPLGTD